MVDESDDDGDDVTVSMEITGQYDEVLSKLQRAESSDSSLVPLVADVETLLETVVRLNGGTRSAIADALPAETNAALDAEAVVDTLQVLERYDLVELVGNTWKPGPRLDE